MYLSYNHLRLFFALVAVTPAWAATFYVAPNGQDTGPGTEGAPFGSLAGAQLAVRKLAGREPVTVLFQTGVYYLPETVRLTAADSGTAQAPVLYAAAAGTVPVLSGGQALRLNWTPGRDGIWVAATPAGLAIDQLFCNGVRQPMARYPNYDADKRPYNGFAADAFSRERAGRWAKPAGGYIHAMHRAHWGGYHYRITGKNQQGEVTFEGGWQNNRQMGMHPEHRFVENIFEELDAPGEWFHDAQAARLYYQPVTASALPTSRVEVVRLRHLVEFRGSQAQPVRHITLRGFVFRHAARTFMDVKEPLLRSDWTIYRGGTVLLEGAEDCLLQDCEFDQVGGNAVFVNRYNRRVSVRGCDIHDAGASGVAFVGDPSAVRNPLFEYGQRQAYTDIDRTPGPQNDNFPADCTVEDSLIRRVGIVEKQATGVQISMSRGIAIRHCSIYETSRAGINISEGTFGGHLIEFCDVFDTVRETGDHGSFNSWGRDRFWGLRDAPPAALPSLALLDAVLPTVIRNSRWRCDHGWDVDLDDGSSHYEIYNNLFLNGGLKLREGFHRRVWNNIAINNSLHPHVWYDNSQDVVTNNIWMDAYKPAGGMPRGHWGQAMDRNLFTREADRVRFADHGCDAHSLAGDPLFLNPAAGDFRVKADSPACKLGFVNFPMDQFGVQKPALKALARTPPIPLPRAAQGAEVSAAASSPVRYWQGAQVHDLQGEAFSAYGVSRESGGVILRTIPAGGWLAQAGIQAEDLIQDVNGRAVRSVATLQTATDAASGVLLRLGIVRAQTSRQIGLANYVQVETRSFAPSPGGKLPDLGNGRLLPIRTLETRPGTQNEELSVLRDGAVAPHYGPVMANGIRGGCYRVDLGLATGVEEVRTFSFNQNGKRAAQRFTLFGSSSPTDPGWNTARLGVYQPLAVVEAGNGSESYLETRVHMVGEGARGLGAFRWLLWEVQPVTDIGENTAFQEFQIHAVREDRQP